jgi:hypothetical protein
VNEASWTLDGGNRPSEVMVLTMFEKAGIPIQIEGFEMLGHIVE